MRVIIILGILAVALLGLLYLAVDKPTPQDLTLGTINKTSVVIGRFYRSHNRLPADLSEIDVPKPAVDSWGRPIVYTPMGTNAYVLRSYGKAGRPGARDGVARMFDADDITMISQRTIP